VTSIEINRYLDLPPELQVAVEAVSAAATAADGVGPLSEDARLAIRYGRAGSAHLVGSGPDGTLIGYSFIAPEEAAGSRGVELMISPEARGHGFGRILVRELLGTVSGPFEVWAHGNHPGARALAAEFGFSVVRELRLLERPTEPGDRLEPAAGSPSRLPPGVRIRTFRPGADEAAWLALNALAFAHHPEQGRWTEADLTERMAEPWFDSAGFLLAERDGAEGGPVLCGFHWTKIHPAGVYGPERTGEVYVLGVDPAAHGQGLGRVLTEAGIRHLAQSGLESIVLYVDGDNAAAVGLYESLGFRTRAVDLLYQRPPLDG
jgi:mycothiol synthase